MTAPTGTILDLLPEVDVIAHLDFDPVIPCELVRCQGEHPRAAWIVTARAACGCTRSLFCCEPCRHRLEARYAAHRTERGPWRCLMCSARCDTPQTIRFTPLKGDRS